MAEAAQDPTEERLVEALRLLADVELELENERLKRAASRRGSPTGPQ